jgi:hypothetical protein
MLLAKQSSNWLDGSFESYSLTLHKKRVSRKNLVSKPAPEWDA